MGTQEMSEKFVKNLLLVLPGWNSKLVRPFRETLNREMSLETYYCLQTIRAFESVSMTELARHLRVPKQQVTKLVDNLSQYDFILRVSDEKDRRLIRICLTEQANAYIDDYYRKNQTFIHMLRTQLTDQELERLSAAVETLGEILPKLK